MDFRYTPSKCFVTFPLPTPDAHLHSILSGHGEALERCREDIMSCQAEGLTSLYNRFHDPGEKSTDIVRLRAIHVEMDKAVTVAYGWRELDLGHGFHKTKEGLRFTISNKVRRVVLYRLLELNHRLYQEEVTTGLCDKKANYTVPREKRRRNKKCESTIDEPKLL